MPYVWRLEDENGVGIYALCGAAREALDLCRDGCTSDDDGVFGASPHPSPCVDPLLRGPWSRIWPDKWFFGFTSLRQFRAWVPIAKARRQIADDKVLLRKYKAARKDYHAGSAQALFRRDRCVLIETRRVDYADERM